MSSSIDKRSVFIDSLVDYVESRFDLDHVNKREAITLAAKALVTDIGAAQDFLDACDIDIKLLCQHCTPQPQNKDQLQFDLSNLKESNGYNHGGGALESQ